MAQAVIARRDDETISLQYVIAPDEATAPPLWIPACAGMTVWDGFRPGNGRLPNDGRRDGFQ